MIDPDEEHWQTAVGRQLADSESFNSEDQADSHADLLDQYPGRSNLTQNLQFRPPSLLQEGCQPAEVSQSVASADPFSPELMDT